MFHQKCFVQGRLSLQALVLYAALQSVFSTASHAQASAELKACQSGTCPSYCAKLKLSPKQTGQCVGGCKGMCTVAPPGRYVTVTSVELNNAVFTALTGGTTLSVDTTQTAPPLDGPVTSYPNPAWIECGKERQTCETGPLAKRKICVEKVNERCKNVPSSILAPVLYYSYLTFAPQTEQPPILFEVKSIRYNALGGLHNFNIDVNYIHWTLGATNLLVGFNPGAASNSPPSASLTMQKIQSNVPTIHFSGDLPSVNLTNMQETVTLTGWCAANDKGHCVAAGGTSVNYGNATSDFTFDWDLTHFPDWPVGDIAGIHDTIANAVNSAIVNAFTQDSAHHAISAAVATAIFSKVTSVVKKDGSTITKIVEQGSNWLVYYTPPASTQKGGDLSGKGSSH